jgi:hypothetical protein
MSLRRKSCETCFKGKRRCDLTFPSCKRCERTGKECRYIYPHPAGSSSLELSGSDADSSALTKSPASKPGVTSDLTTPDIPSLLGPLGEVQPIIGQAKSWDWLLQELKSFPVTFGRDNETGFIHKGLNCESLRALRTAYGLCLANSMRNDQVTQQGLFQMMAAEVVHLLNTPSSMSLLEDLSRLQAIVLYQILRLLHGDLEQRLMAEQQEQIVHTLSLHILYRANTELGMVQSTWESWIVAENARRTAMVAYILYCVYSIHMVGVSSCFSTMATLPVTSRPELWDSRETFSPQFDTSESYDEYSKSWVAHPWRRLKPFERLLLIPCKGFDKVESYRTREVSQAVAAELA